jgi:hypothetical protein
MDGTFSNSPQAGANMFQAQFAVLPIRKLRMFSRKRSRIIFSVMRLSGRTTVCLTGRCSKVRVIAAPCPALSSDGERVRLTAGFGDATPLPELDLPDCICLADTDSAA